MKTEAGTPLSRVDPSTLSPPPCKECTWIATATVTVSVSVEAQTGYYALQEAQRKLKENGWGDIDVSKIEVRLEEGK